MQTQIVLGHVWLQRQLISTNPGDSPRSFLYERLYK
jgi:hypothetical protein